MVRSTQDSLSAIFPTDKKRLGVWKVYHGSILDYCTNAVLYEDVKTLSDERTTNKDDADAKFFRTIGSALLTASRALEVLDDASLQKQSEQYEALFDSDKLWALSDSADSFLRQAVYRLIMQRLGNLDNSIDEPALKKMSKALLGNALRKDQTGSIVQFVALLEDLTTKHSEVWTTYFSSKKKTATALLEGFLAKLPPSASPELWKSLEGLLSQVPIQVVFQTEKQDAASSKFEIPLLEALHQGLSRKENFRAASGQAWKVFLKLAFRCVNSANEQSSKNEIATNYMFPIIRQYILPDVDGISWTIADSPKLQRELCAEIFDMTAEAALTATTNFIQTMSSVVVENMQMSLPEQSQGFAESQRQVGGVADRWNSAKTGLILNRSAQNDAEKIAVSSTKQELRAAMDLLANRNGKPFGAALAIRSALETMGGDLFDDETFQQELEQYLRQKGTRFIGTPSNDQILSLLQMVDKLDPAARLFDTCLSEVLSQSPSPDRTKTLGFFLHSAWPSDPALSTKFLREIQAEIDEYAKGDTARASQVDAVLSNKTVPAELTDSALAQLVDSLSIEAMTTSSLKTISAATKANKDAVQRFLTTPAGPGLGPKLLLLSQSAQDSEVRQLAADLGARTRMLSAGAANDEAAANALVDMIHEGLRNTDNASLTIDVLYGIADQMLQDAEKPSTELLGKLLPAEPDWQNALSPFIAARPDSSLSLTNSLGGAIHWLENLPTQADPGAELPGKDAVGHTVPMRMALYTSKLMDRPGFVTSLDQGSIANLMTRLAIFDEILNDHLSVPAAVPLCSASIINDDKDVSSILWSNRSQLSDFAEGKPDLNDTVLAGLLTASTGNTTKAYYSARAYAHIAGELLSYNQSALQVPEDELLQIVRKPSGSFQEAVRFATAQQTSSRSKIANNLVAELARYDFAAHPTNGLYLITMLNNMMASVAFDDSAFSQQHRLVLFVKHAVATISTSANSHALDSEIFQALLKTAPLVLDIFDNFWTDLIDRLVEFLSTPGIGCETLAAVLRLLGLLGTLSQGEETNDDLKESWADKQPELASTLLQLLQSQAQLPDDEHQARRIVNTILSRQISSLSVADIEPGSFFPVLTSRSFDLQNSAFKVLHRSIPTAQEKLTMEAALAKDFQAKLPEELLSLISEAPSEIHGLASATSIPTHLVQYLYAWKLIFDHWTKASHQIQLDYVTAIKNSPHLPSLLDLVFEATLNSRAKPLDPTSLNFTTFDANQDDPPEFTVNTLLCHLYFLALTHLPTLVRTWYRDDCPRALQKPVAEWTERYFSPPVIAAELAAVSAWVPAQETDTPLEVKLSPRAREVTAMYPIDEQLSAIRISLPANYPLATIGVESVNRVGVDEAKWRSWLVSAQGVMNFASSSGGLGAVTDGLVGWRRNVTGTLKGQSECAICYSIVNADRQLPTKKCGTCKNAFHGSCLFRWFRSSGGSSCPLCRNAFNYG